MFACWHKPVHVHLSIKNQNDESVIKSNIKPVQSVDLALKLQSIKLCLSHMTFMDAKVIII